MPRPESSSQVSQSHSVEIAGRLSSVIPVSNPHTQTRARTALWLPEDGAALPSRSHLQMTLDPYTSRGECSQGETRAQSSRF